MKKCFSLVVLLSVITMFSCTKNVRNMPGKEVVVADIPSANTVTTNLASCGNLCGKIVSGTCFTSLQACLLANNKNCDSCPNEISCGSSAYESLVCTTEPYVILEQLYGKVRGASGGQVSDELLTAVMGNFAERHTFRNGEVTVDVVRKNDVNKVLYSRQLKKQGNTNVYLSVNTTTKCTLTNADANNVLRNLSNNAICTAFISDLFNCAVLVDKRIN